ncbi:MAG: conjugal transfer protein [Hyphomonas sp. BRH_c22]|nr:MAG: conjugal transfer protein [Hyphomonas sp. BRH_c22]MBU2606289.1 VirB3 family type IV secretion system protein [Alphaproteobacteria bacterium]
MRPLPLGYSVSVHRSLTAPILLAGAPRLATIVNGTLAAALGIGLQLWGVGLIFWTVAHGLCVFAARRDPQFTDVLIRHIRHRGYYAC